jgi:hypothetical protein
MKVVSQLADFPLKFDEHNKYYIDPNRNLYQFSHRPILIHIFLKV